MAAGGGVGTFATSGEEKPVQEGDQIAVSSAPDRDMGSKSDDQDDKESVASSVTSEEELRHSPESAQLRSADERTSSPEASVDWVRPFPGLSRPDSAMSDESSPTGAMLAEEEDDEDGEVVPLPASVPPVLGDAAPVAAWRSAPESALRIPSPESVKLDLPASVRSESYEEDDEGSVVLEELRHSPELTLPSVASADERTLSPEATLVASISPVLHGGTGASGVASPFASRVVEDEALVVASRPALEPRRDSPSLGSGKVGSPVPVDLIKPLLTLLRPVSAMSDESRDEAAMADDEDEEVVAIAASRPASEIKADGAPAVSVAARPIVALPVASELKLIEQAKKDGMNVDGLAPSTIHELFDVADGLCTLKKSQNYFSAWYHFMLDFERFIGKGGDIDQRDLRYNGKTLLMRAAGAGMESLVCKLVAKGADYELVNSSNQRAVDLASTDGIRRYLGALNPFIAACERKSIAELKSLFGSDRFDLEKEVAVLQKEFLPLYHVKESPLIVAAILSEFLEKDRRLDDAVFSKFCPDDEKAQAVFVGALYNSDRALAQWLMENKECGPNVLDKDGKAPLIILCEGGSRPGLLTLSELPGFDLDAAVLSELDKIKENARSVATLLSVLLKKNGEITADKVAALMPPEASFQLPGIFREACQLEDRVLIQWLMDTKPFDFSAKNYSTGNTLFMELCEEAPRGAKIILERFPDRIDLNITNKNGKSALDFAKHSAELSRLISERVREDSERVGMASEEAFGRTRMAQQIAAEAASKREAERLAQEERLKKELGLHGFPEGVDVCQARDEFLEYIRFREPTFFNYGYSMNDYPCDKISFNEMNLMPLAQDDQGNWFVFIPHHGYCRIKKATVKGNGFYSKPNLLSLEYTPPSLEARQPISSSITLATMANSVNALTPGERSMLKSRELDLDIASWEKGSPDPSGPVGVSEAQHARPKMEDAVVVDEGVLGVFDGHGDFGRVANFCAENLGKKLKETASLTREDARKAIIETFNQFDAEIPAGTKSTGGATAAILTCSRGFLRCINLGDSFVLVIDGNGRCVARTNDQDAKDPSEISRVLSLGGTVEESRVNNNLNVFRSLGDDAYRTSVAADRPQFIGLRPQIIEISLGDSVAGNGELAGTIEYDSFYNDAEYYYANKLAPGKTQTANSNNRPHHWTPHAGCRFAVIACDGLSDVMNDEEIATFVSAKAAEGLSSKEISRLLVIEAVKKGSQDNISVIVVKIPELISSFSSRSDAAGSELGDE
ncbi:MAG: protein phosphatase [Candidatus Dependentiae bacterium]|nr:protein phosphatase [Candidatus Dependentiae bacterium]